jgi:uncharacterized phage protein (TIGR01671 family)
LREIKFRAKRMDNGRWVYGQYFKTPLTDENSGTSPEVGWFFLTGETRHCIVQDGVSFVIDVNTLGQYTGLIDSNGKEIYEYDIVRYKQRNLEAAFGMVEGEDYIEKTREIKYLDQSFNVPGGFIKELEVIDNIYEVNKN